MWADRRDISLRGGIFRRHSLLYVLYAFAPAATGATAQQRRAVQADRLRGGRGESPGLALGAIEVNHAAGHNAPLGDKLAPSPPGLAVPALTAIGPALAMVRLDQFRCRHVSYSAA